MGLPPITASGSVIWQGVLLNSSCHTPGTSGRVDNCHSGGGLT